MAAVEPVSLGGLHTLADNPYRVILTDNAREADALAALAPANPRVWFPGLAADAEFSALANREVIVWVSRPTQGYWLAGSAVAWLRRLCAVTPAVKIVCSEDAVGPTKLPPETTLADWLPERLVPASQVLPDNVVPIKPPAQAPKPTVAVGSLLTEDELAAAFTGAYPDLRYVGEWGRWLEWTGSRWVFDVQGRVLHYSRQLCTALADQAALEGAPPATICRVKSNKTRCNVEAMARTDPRHATETKEWDADLYALCTPGGIVDLRTGELRPATPDDKVTKQTSATPAGECPTWRQFLAQATGSDEEMQAYLQRVAGYMLTGDTSEEVFFFAHGGGGNGKGTFINTLLEILGEYAKSSSMDVFTESRESRHTTEVARLRGARFVAAQEVEEGKRWAENRLKEMTGGDTLTARFMRQDDFEFKPQFKLLLAGNNKPALRTIDDAIKRRLHLIPFLVKFSGATRDNTLKAKLLAERDGILKWAVDGCLAWQRDGLAPPTSVLAATAEYIESQDAMRQWIEDRCEVSDQGWAIVTKLYASYTDWCKAGGETYVMPMRKWSAKLQERGHKFRRGSAGYKVIGLKLADSMTMARGYQQDPIPGFD